MRIGIVLPELAGGGAERAILRLAGGLIERGHSIDLLLLRPVGVYRKAVPSGIRIFLTRSWLRRVPGARAFFADAVRQGLSPKKLSVSPLRRFRAFQTLRRRWSGARITWRNALHGAAVAAYIQRARPDLLFAALHPANVAVVCGRYLAGTDTPVAISPRNNIALDYPEKNLASAVIFYREADAIVAVSEGVADGAARTLGIDTSRITAIPNPIPVATIAAVASEPVEHPWFAEGEAPVVLAVGRSSSQKDYPTLVRAFAILRRSMEARLVILCDFGGFGHQSGIRKTQELATSLGVIGHVAHLDFDENPFRYMARAGVVTLSSRYEGFPNVLPEAMACGTAVASTDAPYGPDEILEGGRWGPLVPVGDADALAEALVGILRGRRVAAEDLRTRASFFATERVVNAYEELFVSLLRGGPG